MFKLVVSTILSLLQLLIAMDRAGPQSKIFYDFLHLVLYISKVQKFTKILLKIGNHAQPRLATALNLYKCTLLLVYALYKTQTLNYSSLH